MNKEPVYYRKTEIKEFEDFKDGDCVCELCNGWGYFYDCEDNKVSQCYHCLGKGKLDWITNVTGVVAMSGTSGSAASSFLGSGSGGYGRPQPPKKRVSGGKALKQKNNKIFIHQFPNIETTPYKEGKKISLKERIMNTVADK